MLVLPLKDHFMARLSTDLEQTKIQGTKNLIFEYSTLNTQNSIFKFSNATTSLNYSYVILVEMFPQ